MEESRHNKSMYHPCPYMQQPPCMMMYPQQMQQLMGIGSPSMLGQMGQSTDYLVERDEKYIPAVSYGHGSIYSDFWYGDGPYPNYYAGEYPFPYANYPYYPLSPFKE